MPLIACPECHGKLSTAADACPHCGHPNAMITRPQSMLEPSELRCYACERTATTRCQKCNCLSCALHVESEYFGKSGYELRCQECRANSKAFSWIVFLIAIGLALFLLFRLSKGR